MAKLIWQTRAFFAIWAVRMWPGDSLEFTKAAADLATAMLEPGP